MNLIDHIGNKVTVWTVEGNSMVSRTLITADEMGIVVSPYNENGKVPAAGSVENEVFIPWNRIKYVDLIKPREQKELDKMMPQPTSGIVGTLKCDAETTTSSLVDELVKREGVLSHRSTEPFTLYLGLSYRSAPLPVPIEGAARILVVKE